MRALLFIVVFFSMSSLPAVSRDVEKSTITLPQPAYSYTDRNGVSWICRWDEIPDEFKPIPKPVLEFEPLRNE
jgi:hypothetical protein